MTAVAAILFGFLLVVASCVALGLPVAARLPLYKQERWPVAFVTGSAILSGIIFLLCTIHQARRGIFIALAVAAIIAAWKWRRPNGGESFPELSKTSSWTFLALFVPFTAYYLANAMAPEWSPDGSSYHLGWIAKYAAARGFVSPTSSIYGMLSQGVELLYLPAFFFGKHSAAAMIHFAFLLDLVWLIICFGRRIGRPAAGFAAAIFVYASPVVGIDGTSAYIDLALACIGFALFYLLYIWDTNRDHRALLVVAGLLAGFTYAAKYTGAVLAVWAFVVVLWRSRSIKNAGILTAMALVLSTPWMVRNAVTVGNPVAPLFNRFFPNPHVHILFEKQYSAWLSDYDVKNKWELPLEVTIRGEKTTGVLGYLFLLTPLSLLALRRREGRWLLGAALFAAAPYPLNIGTRFLIPALPFVAIALALAMEARFLLPALMITHSFLSWPNWPPGLLTKTVPPNTWRLIRLPWKAALRIEKEPDFLARRSDGYNRARMVELHVPPGEKVLAQNGVADSYTGREVLVGYQSAKNEQLMDILYAGLDEARWPRLIWAFKFPANRNVKRFRLEQTFPVEVQDEQWDITEVRLYRDGAELPRESTWRLTAKPNPWDIQMAFDNSPVTRWRSGDTAKPGMHVDVDLGAVKPLSQIRVESSWDSPHCRVKLHIDSGKGWEELQMEPELIEDQPRFWMRREATRELMNQGVRWLMFAPDEFGGKDLFEAQMEWGVRYVDEAHGSRLFQIQPYVVNK